MVLRLIAFAIPLSLMITGAGCYLILATGSLPYGYDGHKELTLMWLASLAATVSLPELDGHRVFRSA